MPKRMKRTIYYCCESEDLNLSYWHELMIDGEIDEWTVQECANDYYFNHDGWESTWPMTFALKGSKDGEIKRFEVDRDYDPVFIASEISEE